MSTNIKQCELYKQSSKKGLIKTDKISRTKMVQYRYFSQVYGMVVYFKIPSLHQNEDLPSLLLSLPQLNHLKYKQSKHILKST